MAKSDLAAATVKWQQRATEARRRGISDSVWHDLAKKDLQNVAQGHTPLADAEVADSMRAAMGISPIKDPQPSTGGILDVLGNIPSDVQGLVTNFIPGAVGYVSSLPQQLQDFYWLMRNDQATGQKYGMEPSGGIGAFIRDMARTPVFGPLIPGLHTAASLTTDAGRKQLEQHPVSTTLDVLPLAAEAGKIATAGVDTAEAGSATEAFKAGRAIRGATRATADVFAKVPGIGRVADRAAFNQTLLDVGIHPTIVDELSRPLAEIKTQAVRDMKSWVDGDLYQSMAGLTDPERALLYRAGTQTTSAADLAELATRPDLQSILSAVRDFNAEVVRQRESGLVQVPGPDGRMHVYSEQDKVAKLYGRAGRAQDKLDRAQAKLDRIQQTRRVRESKLESRHGKVRRYLEPDAEFQARKPGPITPETLRDSARPLVEAFRDLDPLTVFGRGIFNDTITRQGLTAVLKDVKALSGENGLFARWDAALQAGDIVGAKRTLTQIKRLFRHQSWERTPYAQGLRNHVTDLQREMVGFQSKMRSLGYSMKILKTSFRDEERALRAVGGRTQLRDTLHQQFKEELVTSPPAAYHPLLVQKIREGATDIAQAKFAANSAELDAALRGIEDSGNFSELASYIGDEETKQLVNDVKATWGELARSGIDPVYMHNANPAAMDFILRPSVLPDRYYTPGFVKTRVFNMGTSVHDVLAAITDYKRQLLSEAATSKFVDEHLRGWVRDENTVRDEVRQGLRNDDRRAFLGLDAAIQREIDKHWVTWDPSKHGLQRYFPGVRGQKQMIPKGVDRALGQMTKGEGIPAGGIYDGTMRLWKFAVLTTPRHLSHVALGGLTMGMLREPMMLLHLKQASALVRADSEEFLSRISTNINDLTSDQVFAFAAGRSWGRAFGEVVGSPVRALNRLEDHIAATYKVAAMLTEEAKGLTRDAALREANKIFVDMNSMTPFERTTLRKIFPFYGFSRHLFRYLFTYPSDHPLRAAILANFANQQRQDWNSGLPRSLQFLFFLGAPDVSGNVTGVDYRSIDPFRSFYNDFTLAGFTAQLNPLAQFVMQESGINVLSATPELYPGSHFDPQTGSMVADRPSNPLRDIVEAVIPETQTIDALMGLSDQFRNLRRTNPAAFQRRLYSTLGIPFAPQTFNVPLEVETTQQKRFKDAQTAISHALQSGDFKHAKQYAYVPIPSLLQRFFGTARYATPGQIESVWQAVSDAAAARGLSGVSVHAILPKPTRRRSGG